MCGIVGVAGAMALDRDRTLSMLDGAMDKLVHRGPDGSGRWVAEGLPLGFGHRRLSIIDLTDGSAQPMVAAGPRGASITFNGEIYNYRALREELTERGHRFSTEGDTEVLFAACRVWGVEVALQRIRGMFAFGFFDPADNTLWLARDRFGEKPLYYGCWNDSIVFSSELGALRTVPGFPATIDPEAVDSLMRHSCVGGERSIYSGVRKVPAGVALRIPLSDRVTEHSIRRVTYWDPAAEAITAAQTPFVGSLDQATDELDELLGSSVVGATVSDVPVGAFLSGGIDSTSIVSQLTRHPQGATRTYTIGFASDRHNEADQARSLAKHFGTHHTELTVTAQDALDLVPRVGEVFGEPFADSSQIPTLLVSRLARREVTVALTGDGGDELFGGYPRYRRAQSIWDSIRRLPGGARRRTADCVERIDGDVLERLVAHSGTRAMRARSAGFDDRLVKAAAILRADEPDEVYRQFVTAFTGRAVLANSTDLDPVTLPQAKTVAEQFMLRDVMTYLCDDILTKVDRSAMSVSLETRVPMLTPEIFHFAARLPLEYKIHGTEQKRILRHLLARHVPLALWDQPKQGFSIPLGEWLRGPLHEWASDLLSEASTSPHGFFDQAALERFWTEHCDERRDWGSQLYNVLTFQSWYHGTHSSP